MLIFQFHSLCQGEKEKFNTATVHAYCAAMADVTFPPLFATSSSNNHIINIQAVTNMIIPSLNTLSTTKVTW